MMFWKEEMPLDNSISIYIYEISSRKKLRAAEKKRNELMCSLNYITTDLIISSDLWMLSKGRDGSRMTARVTAHGDLS